MGGISFQRAKCKDKFKSDHMIIRVALREKRKASQAYINSPLAIFPLLI